MIIKLEDTVYFHFGTTSASTGAATDADSTPTVTIEEDGVVMGYAPTVTNVAVGLYRVTVNVTAANGFEAGKQYSGYAVAVVSTVTGRDGIFEFEVAARNQDELATTTQLTDVHDTVDDVHNDVGTVSGLASAIDAKTTNLPADPADQSLVEAAIGTVGAYIDTEITDIQNRLPAALVGGRMAANAEVVGDKTGYALTAAYDAAKTAAQAGDAMTLTPGSVVVEDGRTLEEVLRLIKAALLGATTNSGKNFWDEAGAVQRFHVTLNASNERVSVVIDNDDD